MIQYVTKLYVIPWVQYISATLYGYLNVLKNISQCLKILKHTVYFADIFYIIHSFQTVILLNKIFSSE